MPHYWTMLLSKNIGGKEVGMGSSGDQNKTEIERMRLMSGVNYGVSVYNTANFRAMRYGPHSVASTAQFSLGMVLKKTLPRHSRRCRSCDCLESSVVATVSCTTANRSNMKSTTHSLRALAGVLAGVCQCPQLLAQKNMLHAPLSSFAAYRLMCANMRVCGGTGREYTLFARCDDIESTPDQTQGGAR